MKDKIVIRKGEPRDALAIAEIYAYTWKSAYTGILPDEVIEEKIKGILHHSERLREKMHLENFIVAEVDGKVVGLLNYRKSRHEKFPDSGDIMDIYILSDFQHVGIGRKLFLAGVDEIIKLGCDDLILHVLKDNKKALGFYHHLGGVIVGEEVELFCSQKVPMTELIVKFDNLKKILEDNMER